MTIVLDTSAVGNGNPAASYNLSTTLNHAANVLVVVGIHKYPDADTVSSVTVGGAAATLHDSYVYNTNENIDIWYIFRAAAADETVTVELTGSAYSQAVAASFTGTTQTSPFLETLANANAANGATLSVTVPVGTIDRCILNCGGWQDGDYSSASPGTHINKSYTAAAGACEVNYKLSAASQAMTITKAAATNPWGATGFAILPLVYAVDYVRSASAPYMPLFSSPRFLAYTCATCFSDVINYEVRLGSNGSMGSFQFTVSDPLELERARVGYGDRIRLAMRQGPVERVYTGIIETPTHVRAAKGQVPHLKVTGRGYGLFLTQRNKPVDYTARGIYDILMNASDGLNLAVPEIQFGDYVRDPNVTISTTAKKRAVSDVVDELMTRAGTATLPYTYWICHQDHAGETRENFHFREKTLSPSPIIIVENEVLASEVLGTRQFLENQIEVEYGLAGLSEIRDDATSQNTYGVSYRYTYSPFLTTAASAQDWGDKWLYRSKDPMKAIQLTVPMNLWIEPNYTLRYVTRTTDQIYEVGNVMHRGNEQECVTVIQAATTSTT